MKELTLADKKSVIFLPTDMGWSWEEKVIFAAENTAAEKTKNKKVKSAGKMALRFLTHPLTYQLADAGTTAVLALDHILR